MKRRVTHQTKIALVLLLLLSWSNNGCLILGLVSNVKNFSGELGEAIDYGNKILEPFIKELPVQAVNVLISLAPLVATFILFQIIFFKLKKRAVKRIVKGILYTTIGLVLFLLGVNAGFMEVGKAVGTNIANLIWIG